MEKVHKENVADILPLTPLQSAMLISYLAEPDGNHYKEITRYRLEGNISMDMIAEAIQAVVTKHEMLRTVFRWHNHREPIQMILKEKPVLVYQHEIEQVGSQAQEAKVDELEQESFREPLDIYNNPIKFDIYKLRKDAYYITIINHHILFDGWSNSILLGELYHALCQLVQHKPFNLNDKPGMRNYLEFLKKRDRTQDLSFWKDYLCGVSKRTILPGIHYCPKKGTQESLVTHEEDRSLYRKVKAFSATLSVSAAAAFYAAWGLLYYRENRQCDVVFGIAFDGRPPEVKNINQIIGLFMNSVPLRIIIKENETIEALIHQVYSSLLMIREHQYLPFANIAAQSQMIPAGTLFDSVIVIQNYPVDSKLFTDDGSFTITLHSRKIATGARLTIEIRTFGGFFIDVSYQEQYYNEETVRELIDHYKEILLKMIEGKNRSLREVLNLEKLENSRGQLLEGSDFFDDF